MDGEGRRVYSVCVCVFASVGILPVFTMFNVHVRIVHDISNFSGAIQVEKGAQKMERLNNTKFSGRRKFYHRNKVLLEKKAHSF